MYRGQSSYGSGHGTAAVLLPRFDLLVSLASLHVFLIICLHFFQGCQMLPHSN